MLPPNNPITLRPYQADGIAEMRDTMRQGVRRLLYVLPTGGGKTEMFSYIAREAAARGKRVGIIVHRRELVRQVTRALRAPHGVIAGGWSPTPSAQIQVASVQTLVKRLSQHQFDLLIIDEAHHAVAGSWMRVLEAHSGAHVLGVTATPVRLDGYGLGDVFDEMIVGPSVAELTRQGYLAPAKVYAPSTISTEGVGKQCGDYKRGELAAASDSRKITGDAIEHYKRYADGKPAIAFCVSVQHAYHVAEQFREAGYRAACVEGSTELRERDRAIADLGRGELDVLTSCEIISEGVDVPVVECGIILRPTDSLGLAMQQMGRILRPAPGKTHAVILDHAGNCLRHGPPDMPREWRLTATKQVTAQASDDPGIQIRQCDVCYGVHVQAPRCPYCGHEYAPEPRQVEHVDGELVELKRTRAEVRAEAHGAETLEEMEELEQRGQYKPGWALHRWQNAGGEVTVEMVRDYFSRVAQRRGYKPGWARVRGELWIESNLRRVEA